MKSRIVRGMAVIGCLAMALGMTAQAQAQLFGNNNGNNGWGNNSNSNSNNSSRGRSNSDSIWGGNNSRNNNNGWGGWGGQQQNNNPFRINNGWNGTYNSNGCSGGLHRSMSYGQQCCGNMSGNSTTQALEGILQLGIEALNQPQRPIRPQYVRPQPQYTRPQPQYVRPQPQYTRPQPQYVQPQRRIVRPLANKKPAQRLVTAKKNLQFDPGLDPIDAKTYGLTGDVVSAQANQAVGKLEQALGPAAKDPAVADQMQAIEDKVARGEEVTDADIDDLYNKINASGLGADVTKEEFQLLSGKVIASSEANAVLQTPFPPGGTLPLFPSSGSSVVIMPVLPADEMLMLPGGNIVLGTGGVGQLGVMEGDAAELLDLPIGIGEPIPDSDTDIAKRVSSGVLLMNPLSTNAAVSYVLADRNYTMQPGFTQPLAEGQSWVIRFDRGEGQGSAEYSLTDGTYAFGGSRRGWELYSQTFTTVIDNSSGDDAFNYVIDNTPVTIGGGARRTHTSSYPIYVRFDRGNGQVLVKKIDQKNAVLELAVNSQDGLWDLYPGSGGADRGLLADEPVDRQRSQSRKSRIAALLQQSLLQQQLQQPLQVSEE